MSQKVARMAAEWFVLGIFGLAAIAGWKAGAGLLFPVLFFIVLIMQVGIWCYKRSKRKQMRSKVSGIKIGRLGS